MKISKRKLKKLVSVINGGSVVVLIPMLDGSVVDCENAALTTDGRIIFLSTQEDIVRAIPICLSDLTEGITIMTNDESLYYLKPVFIENIRRGKHK